MNIQIGNFTYIAQFDENSRKNEKEIIMVRLRLRRRAPHPHDLD